MGAVRGLDFAFELRFEGVTRKPCHWGWLLVTKCPPTVVTADLLDWHSVLCGGVESGGPRTVVFPYVQGARLGFAPTRV